MSTTSAQPKEKKKKIVVKKKVPYGAVSVKGEILYLFSGSVVKTFEFLEKINQALKLAAEFSTRKTLQVTATEYEKLEQLVTSAEQERSFEKERIDMIYSARIKFERSVEVIKETLESVHVKGE